MKKSELKKLVKEVLTEAGNAAGEYEKRYNSIQDSLSKLDDKLRHHKMTFHKGESTNWAMAGDLGHIDEKLKELAEFLR